MSAALYIGRVGALAVALGIGVAIAGVPGLAWAGPEPGSDPADSPGTSQGPSTDPGDSPSDSGDTGDTGDTDLEGGGDSGDPGDPGDADDSDGSAGGMKVDSSGGALTSTHGKAGAKSNNKDRVADPPKRRSLITPRNLSVTTSAPKTAAHSADQPGRRAQVRLAPTGVAPWKAPAPPQLKQTITPTVDMTLSARKPLVSPPVTATMSAAPKPTAMFGVSRWLSLVTLSTPIAGDRTPVTTDSSLLAAFLARGRQVSRRDSVEDESVARTVDSPQNSLMMMAAVTSPPTAGTLDQNTGAVTGSLNGYTVTSQPTSGTVTVTGDTYTYKPTVAARLRAATTSQPDFDSFAVAMSGQPASTVTVPILPAALSNQSSMPAAGQPALNNPTGLAVNGTYAYVTNQNANTVSVINAAGAVVKTIAVGSQPAAVAINSATGLAYVTNRASGTVSVINTASNTVVGSAIRVGTSPQDVAVNTMGTPIVVVANNGSSSVSIIEPTLNNKVTTVSLGFGNSAPTAVAISADGTRAYVTHRNISGGGAVSVINTSTRKVISTIAVGSSPLDVAVAGTNVYVANSGSGSVSVINTAANNGVTTINVGSSPTSLAVSPDGSVVVVARSDDNVAVIDTKTKTVIGTQLLLDTTSGDGGHVVAFGSDGRILISDARETTVRVVGLARGNTVPVSIKDPTVDIQDLSNGVVSGSLNVKDWDDDPLSFTVNGLSAATGSISFDSTGGYIFTPTQAARDQAAQPDGPDTVSFTVRVKDRFDGFKDVAITVPVAPTQAAEPVDTGLSATTTPISLGAWPDFLASRGSRLYVLNAGEATVSVVDTDTNTVIQTSEQLQAGGAMTLSPDGKRLYVAEYMGNHVYVLDPETLELDGPPINVVTTYGGTLAVSPDSTRLYVGSTDVPVHYDEYGDPVYGPSSAYVSVVDTATRNVVAQIPIGISVGNVELSPDGKLLYANAPDRVYVIDTATNTRVASFTVGGQPADVAFSPDGTRAYITNLSSGELYVVDTATSTVVAKPIIDTTEYRYFPEWDFEHEAGFPTDLATSEDGSRVYIARGDDIVVLDAATNSVIGAIRVATDIPNQGAQSLTIADDGTIFVTLEDTVVAVDVSSSPTQSNLALARESGANLMMMAAAVNSAPTASPTKNAPDENTGVIVGNVNASDAEQNPMTYTVSSQPTRGTVTVDAAGAFKYTPTQAERLRAGQSTGVDPDSFTITVSDGQDGTTPVTIQVAVLPALTAAKTDMALGSGANPSAVALKGNLAYVADATAKTVKVVNTDTNQVVATIQVQTSPSAIALSPDGNSVWVANSGSRTVQRIDTGSNTVSATVTVGTNPTALAVTGDSVWVANAGSNNVTRINTSTLAVRTITVGQAPSAIAVSEDRVYVANKNGNSISVISTSSNTVISTKSSVSAPSALAVTGGKVYVTQQSLNRVLVLNSTTMAQITTISVQSAPTSIVATNDGSLAYVANSNDRLSVIDTRTNTVIATLIVGTPGTAGGHTVAVDRTGENTGVYVTDAVEKSVRVWSLPRGNTAPVSTANQSVETTDSGNGAVTGSLNVKDWDDDSLSYSVASQPTSGTIGGSPIGTVSFTPAGKYTFTPTKAARDAASRTAGADTATFVVRATDTLGATKDVTVTVPIDPKPLPPNTAPWANPTGWGAADLATGKVTGMMNGGDQEGDQLTYSVWDPSRRGTTTVDPTTGAFTYTPSLSSRLQANSTGTIDYDHVSIAVSDGQATTNYSMLVQIVPARLEIVSPIGTGQDPTGIAVSGDRVFVINQLDKTLTVRNTATNTTSTIALGSTPTALAVSPDGNRAYVTLPGTTNKLAIVDTANGQIVNQVTVGASPAGVAVSSDGRRVYVTNSGSNTVSVIDADPASATYNTEIRRITVGAQPTGIAVAPDGRKLYVTLPGSDSVAVVDTVSNTVVATIGVGDSPRSVAVTPDGSKVFVVDDDGTVAVIDPTYNWVAAVVQVGSHPTSVTIGRDGTAYVANSDDTITLIDTKTAAVIATMTLDTSAETGAHQVAVNADGTRIYVTDTFDDNLRVLAVMRGNTAPQYKTSPTVGTADRGTGLVNGSISGVFSDPEGDPLTYTASTPTSGSVVINPTTGAFEYRPSQAARDLALTTQQNETDTFTVSVSDGQSTVDTTVTVPIGATNNVAPQWTGYTANYDPISRRTTGTVTAADEDAGDTLRYTVTGSPWAGSVTMNAAGQFEYVPLYTGPNGYWNYDIFEVAITDGHYTTYTYIYVETYTEYCGEACAL